MIPLLVFFILVSLNRCQSPEDEEYYYDDETPPEGLFLIDTGMLSGGVE